MKKIIFITMALFSAFFVCAQVAPNATPVYQLNPAPDSGMVAYSIANYKGIRNQPIWAYLDSLVTGGSSTALTTSYVDTYSTGNTNVQTIVDYIIPRLSLQQVSDNTWYVSTGGNNSAGIKGDPTHPLRDPWAAKDSCISGDQIFVFQGLYTSGIVGSGADRENDGTDLEYTALNKDSVTLFLDAGAEIMNTAAIIQYLFYDTTGQNFKVVGQGAIRNIDSRARIGFFDNEDSQLYINLYKVTNGENAAAWGYGFYMLDFNRIEIITDLSEVSNSRFIHKPTSSHIRNASFTFSTKDFYIPSITDETIRFNQGTMVNSSVNISIGNIYGNPLYSFMLMGPGMDSSTINIDIGSFNLKGFNSSYPPLGLLFNNSASIKNSVISLNCSSCQGDQGLITFGRANGPNENSFVSITGNYHTTAPLIPLMQTTASLAGIPVFVNANMTAENSNVISKKHSADFNLSGIFETYADTNVIVNSNPIGRTTLGNLQIKQPAGATSVSIRSTIADTINTYSAYSLAATSSNVTFKNLTEYGATSATATNIYNSDGTFSGPRAINAGAFDYAVTNIEDFTSRAISHWFRGPADEYYLLMQKSGSFGNFVLRGDVFQLQGRTGSGAPTWMQFNDLAGGQYFGIRAPDVVPTSYLYQWPDSLGAVGDQLTIESISGTDVVLKWRDPMTGIPLSMESGSEGGRINVPDLAEDRIGEKVEEIRHLKDVVKVIERIEEREKKASNWLWPYLFGFLGGLSAYVMIALFKFALSKKF